MDLLVSASFVSAFIAGVAALFAPCCITVLLPTYFASIFKEKRTVFLMTFVYFLGLLAVFLPIGLGVTALASLFRQNHDALFYGGGAFLLTLGILLMLGKQFSLPMGIHPVLKKYDVLSIFLLGIFSAVATTCCAPVLAGVLALSSLSGSLIWGALYTITYVLGMVTPLFILAAILDKTRLTQQLLMVRKPIKFKLFFYQINNTVSNLVVGILYTFIGGSILFLTFNKQLTMQSSYQLSVNLSVAQVTKYIGMYTKIIPDIGWAIIFILITGTIVAIAVKQYIDTLKSPKEGEHEI